MSLSPERIAELREILLFDSEPFLLYRGDLRDLLDAADEAARLREQLDALLADAEQIIGYLPRHGNAVVPRFAVDDLAGAVRHVREQASP